MITITFQGKDLEEVADQAIEFVAAILPPVQVQGRGAHDDVSDMLAFNPAVRKAMADAAVGDCKPGQIFFVPAKDSQDVAAAAAAAAGEVEDKVSSIVNPAPEQAALQPPPTPAPAEPPWQEKKADPEELRAQLRAALAPVVAGPRAAEAKALIAANGGAVSKIPEDSLPVVLEAARALAS
jgi:hypothetical protein